MSMELEAFLSRNSLPASVCRNDAILCHIKTIFFIACGNGVIDYGEDCDDSDLCCFQCKFRNSSFVCRDAADICDIEGF